MRIHMYTLSRLFAADSGIVMIGIFDHCAKEFRSKETGENMHNRKLRGHLPELDRFVSSCETTPYQSDNVRSVEWMIVL